MKKQSKRLITLTVLLAVFCTGYAAVSFGAPSHGVKYTKHNLGTTGSVVSNFYSAGSNPETEICIFCHTPHNAVAGRTFLWNRTNTVSTFLMYTGSPTLSFDRTHGNEIGSVSKMCLSCHDGAGAINAMANPRPGGTVTMFNALAGDQIGDMWDGPDGWMGEWRPNIGEAFIANPGTANPDTYTGGGVLVNDHPISFVYSESRVNDTTIKTEDGGPGGNAVGGLPLWYETLGGYGGFRVECVTCHDPHINHNDGKGGNSAYAPFLRKANSSSSLCFTCHDK